ncbi:ribose-5-phosphate isomerase RpiA [Kouleothrix sp.]|uniref:ribose-5-phosphate isomerase RpiA n=1 Tax=Kouleothrix sp. TaxID=2779161 RepID=UPI00391A9C5C
MTPDLESLKRQAAEAALEYVQSGMALGLGTGSTAKYLLYGLADRLGDGRLREIVGVPTSERTAALARELGIPLATLAERPQLDLAIDGADEIDPQLELIKGLGGALLREKIVAASAARMIIVSDSTKRVGRLGTRAPLPVEVIAFALPLAERRLSALGCTPLLRRAADGSAFVTDEGNHILDCRFGDGIGDARALDAAIHAIPGVVEHGMFIGMAGVAIVAGDGGITRLARPAA